MTNHQYRVPVGQLRARTDPDSLGFETTAEVPPNEGTLGQERALRALEFGLQVDTNGYHTYAAGQVGTGKMSAIESLLERIKTQRPTPPDWCYVHNFDEPDRPLILSLPSGRGRQFEADLRGFVEQAGEVIPRALQSEEYARRKVEELRVFEERRAEISRQVAEDARSHGFAIEATQVGIVTVPLVKGRPMTKEEFDNLPEEERQALQQKGEQLKEELERTMRAGRLIEQEARERVEQLDRETARAAIEANLNLLLQKYDDLPDIVNYIWRVGKDIPQHVDSFKRVEDEGREAVVAALFREDHLVRYRVNLFVDNSSCKGAPVVFEYQPTYYNLFGRIDYRPRLGSAVTDLTMIKSGAIHRANGGYLILRARDALSGLLVWETLKNALLSGEARIENLGEQYTAVPTARIRPTPVPLDVKIVLVGPPILYYLLNGLDEDFGRLFGVRADFDIDMARSEQNVREYIGLISSIVERDNLRPFHRSAVAKMLDYGGRLAQHQQRLSTRLLEIARLAREANYWATISGNGTVMGEDVDRAISERQFRTGLAEDRFRRHILESTVRIDTSGSVPAQVNGLSVIDLGDHAFGRPARITARTSVGTQGVVNIEREIELSGRIHSKGVLILSSYLSGKYAQDRPLALSASLTFEQTYDEVEGDSASSAELYALLSSLSGLPLKQGIAVTGSVNQKGEVQAIGGVNDKIEGFFHICQKRGLNGEQGVAIPRDNVKNLMLKEEVVEAVQNGVFHIWAVENVDQGIELLTGVAAGERSADGWYPVGTVNHLVDRRLKEYSERLKEFRPTGAGERLRTLRPTEEREAAQQWTQRSLERRVRQTHDVISRRRKHRSQSP